MNAINRANKSRFCLVSSWRINHLGRKPVRGGRPPSDSNTKGVMAAKIGDFAHDIASELMLVALLSLKMRKVEDVMAM